MPSREACASAAREAQLADQVATQPRGEQAHAIQRAQGAAQLRERVARHDLRVERRAAAGERCQLGLRDGARRARTPVAAAPPQQLDLRRVAGARRSPQRELPRRPAGRDRPRLRLEAQRAGTDLGRLPGGAEREQRGAVAEVQQRRARRIDPRADDVAVRLEAPGLHVAARRRGARARDDEAQLLAPGAAPRPRDGSRGAADAGARAGSAAGAGASGAWRPSAVSSSRSA